MLHAPVAGAIAAVVDDNCHDAEFTEHVDQVIQNVIDVKLAEKHAKNATQRAGYVLMLGELSASVYTRRWHGPILETALLLCKMSGDKAPEVRRNAAQAVHALTVHSLKNNSLDAATWKTTFGSLMTAVGDYSKDNRGQVQYIIGWRFPVVVACCLALLLSSSPATRIYCQQLHSHLLLPSIPHCAQVPKQKHMNSPSFVLQLKTIAHSALSLLQVGSWVRTAAIIALRDLAAQVAVKCPSLWSAESATALLCATLRLATEHLDKVSCTPLHWLAPIRCMPCSHSLHWLAPTVCHRVPCSHPRCHGVTLLI